MKRPARTDESVGPYRADTVPDGSGADAGRAGGDGTEHIMVDGTATPLRPGDTVAACMLAAGRQAWHTTRVGQRPRGAFCGVGACFDCLVTVNEVTGVRACRYEAQPGDEVRTGTRVANEDGAQR